MSGKLYVGNLPLSATETDLQAKFAQFGRVLSVVIETDATTGRRKRSALVEMESGAEAQAAIDRLNMTQYDDAVISVYKVPLEKRAQAMQGASKWDGQRHRVTPSDSGSN